MLRNYRNNFVSQNIQMNSYSKKECLENDYNNHSQSLGKNGPALIQDTMLNEELKTFVHSQNIQRIVHTKGWGALGYFQTYKSMQSYTKASFLQNAGKITNILVRFSLAVSNMGTPDTSRNVRGFATRFYTDEGIFDLLCNHIPVFSVRDAMLFPESIKVLSPSPINNLSDPKTFWNFVAHYPQSLHFALWLYSDWGTIKSLKNIRTSSVNTYVWKNAQNIRKYIKYHWIPLDGIKYINREESIKLAGESPDFAGIDLYNTLNKGHNIEYELCVQIIDPKNSNNLDFDPLDCTKIWAEKDYPLIPVGKLTLEKNPDNYKSQVENIAFNPSNLIEGIELSSDKMLQGRSFIYPDAQRYRLGPDFRNLPVNYQSNWSAKNMITSSNGEEINGIIGRWEIDKIDDFTQAGDFYISLSKDERNNLLENISIELSQVNKKTKQCVLSHFKKANKELGETIQSVIM